MVVAPANTINAAAIDPHTLYAQSQNFAASRTLAVERAGKHTMEVMLPASCCQEWTGPVTLILWPALTLVSHADP